MIKGYKYSKEQLELLIHNKRVYGLKVEQELIDKLNCVNKPINCDYTHKPVSFTVKTFCAKYCRGTFIVLVNKHALVIKNGIVIDNGNMRFTGYRRVVESVIRVK